MHRILVFITLSESGIEIIKSNHKLPENEMEIINKWKKESVLENFFISVSKKSAVLIFKDMDESSSKKLIESLPYFPFMSKIEYHDLQKQF